MVQMMFKPGLRTVLLLAACAALLSACAANNRPLQLITGAGQVYPAQALEQGIEGAVTVRYDVNVAGEVVAAEVIRSEPAGVFDEAALQAVRSWRFNPPVRDGVKQPARDLQSTLTFKLGETDAYDNY